MSDDGHGRPSAAARPGGPCPAADAAEKLHLFAALADLKLQHYDLALTLDALIESLARRGVLDGRELQAARRRVDRRAARRALSHRPAADATTLRAPS